MITTNLAATKLDNIFYVSEELLTKVKEFTSEIKNIFEAAITQAKSLEEIQTLTDKIDSKKKQDISKVIESLIYREFRAYSILQYINMEKTNDYGPMGEQRVSISFCRNILQIPNDREVTQFDADRFRRIIDEEAEKYKGKGNLVPLIKDPAFNFELMNLKLTDYYKLNNILHSLKSDKEIIFSFHKGSPSLFFGILEKRSVGDIVFNILKKEFTRTPENVLSIAATQGDTHVRVRYESCEVIFYNKWQRFYEQTKAERKKALNHPNSAIREGIKAKALQLYKTKTVEEVKKIKPLFIEEMIDGIIWHEIGHKVGESEKYISAEMHAISMALGRGENFVRSLCEALADWGPKEGNRQGAISRFCEFARQDKTKALRTSWVYMSDNWFIDEEEDFMAYQTDILTALFLAYFEDNGDINFDRLEKDIPRIHAFLVKQYLIAAQGIYTLLNNSKYQVGSHLLDLEGLKRETLKLYKGTLFDKSKEELVKDSHFWTNIIAYARKFGKDFNQELESYFKREGDSLCLNILKIISKNNPEKYKNSLREYIFSQYKAMGILQEPKKVDYTAAIDKACAAMKMPEKLKTKVLEQARKVMGGENFDISISYEGEKDPFIATIQEMMIKSNYGDIKTGMLVGELFNPDDSAEKRKEYIKDELENLRDQLESEMYMEIDVLKVNKRYNIKPMLEELLAGITFFDGRKLKDKIKEITYTDFTGDALMEVFIPLKRGYMDWNTSQAVWRINQDLRPDEFIMQWTIDKDFLESLIEVYQ